MACLFAAPTVSLKLDIDPNHPRMFPTFTWLGSESAVFNLREQVLNRMEVNFNYP